MNNYIVSTDDVEIAEAAKKYGANVPFLRPSNLASDTATSADSLIHSVEWMEENENIKYDIIVELMCTNPFKKTNDIDNIIKKLVDTNSDSVVSVIRIWDQHPIRVKKIIDDKLVDFCVYEKPENRRQDLNPPAYLRNGAIYAVKRDVLLETRARYGTVESRPYIMDENLSINIDSPLDFLAADYLMKMEGDNG